MELNGKSNIYLLNIVNREKEKLCNFAKRFCSLSWVKFWYLIDALFPRFGIFMTLQEIVLKVQTQHKVGEKNSHCFKVRFCQQEKCEPYFLDAKIRSGQKTKCILTVRLTIRVDVSPPPPPPQSRGVQYIVDNGYIR